MVNTVTFTSGNSYNDGTSAPGNLRNSGHRTNLIPMLSDTVAEVALAVAAAATAEAAADSVQTAGGFSYTWSTNTSSSDPTTGKIKANNATLSSATAIYISETSNTAQALQAIIASWDDSTSTIRGFLKLTKQTDLQTFALFSVTGSVVDNGTWDTLTVSYVGGSGSFSDTNGITVQFIRNGDKGDTGATGATGIGFTRDIVTATGSSNAFVLTPASALGAYADQQVFIFEANHTITGPATVNISGLGAKAIRKNFDEPLEANDIKTNQMVLVVYEASTDRFQLLNPIGQMLTNPEIRGWNRQIVYRNTVSNTTSDQIAIVFDTATRLHNLKHKMYSGSCTITLKKNGTAINFGGSPSTSVNVTTTQTTVAVNHSSLAYIDFAAGDRLDIAISSAASTPTMLTVGLDTTENYA